MRVFVYIRLLIFFKFNMAARTEFWSIFFLCPLNPLHLMLWLLDQSCTHKKCVFHPVSLDKICWLFGRNKLVKITLCDISVLLSYVQSGATHFFFAHTRTIFLASTFPEQNRPSVNVALDLCHRKLWVSLLTPGKASYFWRCWFINVGLLDSNGGSTSTALCCCIRCWISSYIVYC